MIKNVLMCFVLAAATKVYAQTATPATDNMAKSAPTMTMTDDQIAKVLVTINDGEIDAAKMAKHKAKNDSVKDFAKMMIDEHKKNEKETKSLSKKEDIEMKDSDLSKKLKDQAKASNKEIKKADKEAFDKAYVAEQITMHENALNLIRNELLPNAKNPNLKAHLEKTQAAVSTHLEHVRQLNTQIQ